MTKFKTLPVLLATLLLGSTATAQSSRQLLEPEQRDLTPREIFAPDSRSFVAQSAREAVTFSRPLAAEEQIVPRAAAITNRSKQFWREVSGRELENGVAIHAAAPGALVRINPSLGAGFEAASWGDRKAIEPQRLIVIGPDGRRHGDGLSMDLAVTDDQLRAAGSPFPEGTSAFRLKAELGAGTFVIRTEGLSQASGARFVVHVLDQNSDLELAVGTLRPSYLHGDLMRVNVSLSRADQRASMEIAELDGLVRAPSGKTFAMTFRRLENGAYRGRLHVDANESTAPGLWEIEAFAKARVSGLDLERASRSSFAVALPTARFTGDAEVDQENRTENGLIARIGIEAATSGRYEVRALLYGTDVDGRLRPLGLADSASWLEAGNRQIELHFDAGLFVASSLTAPYELRDLQLLDQGRMALMQQQARALMIFE